jgi:hypothetical protein
MDEGLAEDGLQIENEGPTWDWQNSVSILNEGLCASGRISHVSKESEVLI